MHPVAHLQLAIPHGCEAALTEEVELARFRLILPEVRAFFDRVGGRLQIVQIEEPEIAPQREEIGSPKEQDQDEPRENRGV